MNDKNRDKQSVNVIPYMFCMIILIMVVDIIMLMNRMMLMERWDDVDEPVKILMGRLGMEERIFKQHFDVWFGFQAFAS